MRKLVIAGALALGLAGCSQAGGDAFNANLIRTTQNLVALNNALVQVNATLIDNALAQARAFAPYACGAYALASAIVNDSAASQKVNALIAGKVALSVGAVAVKDVCAALGQSTTVTKAPPAAVPAIVTGN